VVPRLLSLSFFATEDDGHDPFDNLSFRLKSFWSPVGSRPIETLILQNEIDLNKIPVWGQRRRNLNREEVLAREQLKSNRQIVIKPAEKKNWETLSVSNMKARLSLDTGDAKT